MRARQACRTSSEIYCVCSGWEKYSRLQSVLNETTGIIIMEEKSTVRDSYQQMPYSE